MKKYLILILLSLTFSFYSNAQITERTRPTEWNNLVNGGRFLDRFLPIPKIGQLTRPDWGAEGVIPRFVDNGIEDKKWSYWGGNILKGGDNLYHLFVCRWREDAAKGHMEWSNSTVVHAVCKNSMGPFKVTETIGKGHNPEAFRLKDGGYVIYVINGQYYSDNINGPWEYRKFEFNARDRNIPDGLSNLTFARRQDGSFIMMCRGGGIWFSQNGQSTYNLVTEKSVYPPYDGRYEDPVIWRTNIQYHMIVHDWLGRIAYYMRSKNGINWKLDPGEAYVPGIAKYEDGTTENWFKYERIKFLQDQYGRALQANFAVIDTIKWNDLGNDHHSSKNITIPLTVGKLISIINKKPINSQTKSIKIKIKAEKGFNPHTDIDFGSLRFGAPQAVNFGKGCKIIRTKKTGKDLVIIFQGKNNGFNEENFAAKLLGKTTDGKLLFAYARLPWVDYLQPALSARLPEITYKDKTAAFKTKIQNFGQTVSEKAVISIQFESDKGQTILANGTIPALQPFESTIISMKKPIDFTNNQNLKIKVIITHPNQKKITLSGEVAVKSVK